MQKNKTFHVSYFRVKTVGVVFMMLLHAGMTYAQQNDLLEKATEFVYSNPDEAIKIGEHLLKNAEDVQQRTRIELILGKSYLVKGDYNLAAQSIFNKANNLPELNIEIQTEAYLLKAKLLRLLYLDKQSQNHLFKAQELVSQLPKNARHDSLQFHIVLENIYMKLDRRENHEALNGLDNAYNRFRNFLKTHPIENRNLYLAKEMAYNKLAIYDSAFVYLDKTRFLIDSTTHNNLFEKAIIYSELGHLNLQKKDFRESEISLFIALKFAELIDNPVLLKSINRDIAINYLATNQKSKHKVYNDEFLVLNNNVELMEETSINTVYNLLTQQQEDGVANQQDTHTNYLYLLLVGFLVICTIGVLVLLKSEGRKKRLKEIIKYLEISRSNLIRLIPTTKTNHKRIVIPEETEQGILAKLKRFENSQKFLNKDMSLAVLSGLFDTNTKYLSEIINTHYHDNFNTFINKLRIEYIINKLKNEPNYINYKISFLAEESGFSSHSSFATVFKSIVGMSPATFIDLLKTEREIGNKQDL